MLKHQLRTVACVTALLLLSACSATMTPRRIPVYAGNLHALDDVGVFLNSQAINMYSVDGILVDDYVRSEFPVTLGGREIEILPGKHVVEYTYHIDLTTSSSSSRFPLKKIIDVEAGHVYTVSFAAAPHGAWDVAIRDVSATERIPLLARRAGAKGEAAAKK